MNEVIDRVARAICHYPNGPSDTNSCCQEPMGEKRCQVKARAAIMAMREPTTAMTRHPDLPYSPAEMKAFWQLMIDEVLK